MELSLKDLKELIETQSGKMNPWTQWLGKKVYVQTVTYHYTGQVVELVGDESAILEDAAWIADTGRFAQAMETGEYDEIEPIPLPIQLNYGSVVMITTSVTLPRKQK
jgi:hypothetical protein